MISMLSRLLMRIMKQVFLPDGKQWIEKMIM